MYQIDKNVPIPAKKANSLYPFSQMAVGDSFLAPKKSATSSMYQFMKSDIGAGMKFISRPVEGGVRIWRTV